MADDQGDDSVPTTKRLTPKYEISIDGSAAPAEIAQSLISIVVRMDTELSDAIELTLKNDDLEWSDGDTLAEGTQVQVKLGYVELDAFDVVASGVVVRREAEFPERGGSTIRIVAYDSKTKMKQGKKSKTWTNVKHSDVVSQLCQANGLQADVDDTSDTVPYLFQIAQSDLSFVRQLAGLNGYEVYVDVKGTKLSFKKPSTGDATGTTLKWGQNLLSFRARFNIHGQSQSVSVRGWDSKQKQAIVGSAQTSDLQSKMGSKDVGAAVAQQKLGTRAGRSTTIPVSSTEEATAFAKAQMNGAMQNFAEADGSCQGEPTISPGVVLDIQSVGARSSGQYYVTSVLHSFEPRGFTTHFRVKRPGSGTPPVPPPAPPAPPPPAEDTPQQTWIEFEVVPAGMNVPVGTKYTLTLPDGRQVQGTLDETRTVRVDGVTNPGDCKVEFEVADEPAQSSGDAGADSSSGDSGSGDSTDSDSSSRDSSSRDSSSRDSTDSGGDATSDAAPASPTEPPDVPAVPLFDDDGEDDQDQGEGSDQPTGDGS